MAKLKCDTCDNKWKKHTKTWGKLCDVCEVAKDYPNYVRSKEFKPIERHQV